MKFFVIAAGVCLAVGLAALFGFCQGTTGMSLGNSIALSSLHLDITSTGLPMLCGMGLAGLGALFLAIAWVMALSEMFTRHREPRRREEPFRD